MRKFINLSNKGSTLVAVIVTIGLVGVFSSMAMMATSTSYQSKQVDNRAKNNFYSSEEVLDQIKTGLQNDMAQSMSEAYFKVLADYQDTFYEELIKDTDSDDKKGTDDENVGLIDQDDINAGDKERLRSFKEECAKRFLSRIGKYVTSPNVNNGTVNPDALKKYMSSVYTSNHSSDNIEIGVSKNGAAGVDNISYSSVLVERFSDGIQYIEGIQLNDIGIKYLNEYGYVNTIFTDLRIKIPDIDFKITDPDIDTEYEKYALMAKSSVNVENSSNVLDIDGGIWVGKDFNLKENARLELTADNSYIGGRLDINTSGANVNSLKTGTKFSFNADKNDGTPEGTSFINKSYLVAGDIMVQGSAPDSGWQGIDCNGNVYVANDLSLNVDYVKANFTGTYHGYGAWADGGGDITASKYSSIIINNRFCSLDMKLRQLTIYGSAFIKTDPNVAGGSYQKPTSVKDVITGDSLIVRGNQIAYLVPTEYMPTKTNPVTQAEARAIDASISGATLFNDSAADNDKFKPMRDYIAQYCLPQGTDPDDDSHIMKWLNASEPVKTIYYSYSDASGSDDFVAYFYLNFNSPAAASAYYHNAVRNDASGTKLVSDTTKETLLGLIPTDINIECNDYSVIGNHLEKLSADTNGVKNIPDNPKMIQGNGEMKDLTTSKKVVKYLKAFLKNEYPRKIQEVDAGTSDDSKKLINKDAVDTVIDWEEIKNSVSGDLINTQIQVEDDSGTLIPVKIWVRNGNMDISSNSTGIFISTGNIKIYNGAQVNGLVIAGGEKAITDPDLAGNIIITNGAKLYANPRIIKGIFAKAAMVKSATSVLDGGSRILYFNKLFNGYDLKNTASTSPDLDKVEMKDMFEYVNWTKQ